MCSVTVRDINWTLFASRFSGIFLPWGKAAGVKRCLEIHPEGGQGAVWTFELVGREGERERCRIHEGSHALMHPKDVGVCIPVVFKESCNFLRHRLSGVLINQVACVSAA